ncbi:MAG: hypothetical protein KDA69_11115 [Planctomycetaceae bacterium]|nr:hypothetical protein [Planctomycetaceae bacterium]
MASTVLNVIEQQLKAGSSPGALTRLETYLNENPQDLDAWLLAAQYIPDRSTRLKCLERALRLSPGNARAVQLQTEILEGGQPPFELDADIPFVEIDESEPAEDEHPSNHEIYVIAEADETVADDDFLEEHEVAEANKSFSLPAPGKKKPKTRKGQPKADDQTIKWLKTSAIVQGSVLGLTVLILLCSGVFQYFSDGESEEVKLAYFEIRKLQRQVEKMDGQLQEATESMAAAEEQLQQVANEIPRLKVQLDQARRDVNMVERERNDARQQLAQTIAQQQARERELQRERNALARNVNAPIPNGNAPVGVAPVAPVANAPNDTIQIKLPRPIIDSVPANGGRQWVLRLEGLRGLTIVDMEKKAVTGTINLPSEDFIYTAGGDKILIFFKENSLLQTWSVSERKALKTKPNPNGTVVTSMIMGHSNDRVALVRSAVGTSALDRAGGNLLDLNSLEPFDPQPVQPDGRSGVFGVTGHNSSFRDFVHYRSNADLTLISEWCTSHSPTGLGIIRISGGTSQAKYDHTSVGSLVVGDDNRIYTSAGAIYNSQLTKVANVPAGILVPGIGGAFFVAVGNAEATQLYQCGSSTPLTTLAPLSGLRPPNDAWTRSSYTSDRRVLFAPQLGYLAYIPFTNQEVMLRPFDLKKELERSGVDFLIVTSTPETTFTPGKAWNYQLQIEQKAESPVSFALQANPEGMSIDKNGKITWPVPKSQSTPAQVVVLVKNEANDSTFHNFELSPK